jgi:hypothetical protein
LLFPKAQYEIEFRCQFSSVQEAYRVLPFLKASLKQEFSWFDHYHGLKVFQSGQVLRASGVSGTQGKRYFLGWKGPDHGHFTNLRREYNEETTGGIQHSAILHHFCKTSEAYTLDAVEPALENAGYPLFMSYEGHSLTGRLEALGVNTKLMHCAVLRWPILVEMEKISSTQAEAKECEKQLLMLSREYHLDSHLVKEEPGTLLYQKTFGK